MTGVTRDQHFAGFRARDDAFAVGQAAGRECAVDVGLVTAIDQTLDLPMGQTESPRRFVVRRAIWHPVRVGGQTEQMRPQLGECHRAVNRHAVIHHMQIGVSKCGDGSAGRVVEPGVPNVPFIGDRPVQHLGARRHSVLLQGYSARDHAQGLANALTGNAAANWKQLPQQVVHQPPDRCGGVKRGRTRRHQTICGVGTGRMNLPERRRYSSCWRRISSDMFQASINT